MSMFIKTEELFTLHVGVELKVLRDEQQIFLLYI